MQKDVPLLPLVLIRHYSHPHCIEEAVYNYIKYIEDITLRNYNEKQIDITCKYAVNIIEYWYLPNNIWNNSINNWLEQNPKNKIYHEIILQLLLIKEANKTNKLFIL